MADLDRRWEWHEATEFGSAGSTYIRGMCNHLDSEVVDVTLTTGEEVARLCTTCDRQLPPLNKGEGTATDGMRPAQTGAIPAGGQLE